MAGHSKFKNIMHRKGRADAARSKLFSKLSREITVAAKSGMPDPAMNPRLRLAVTNARAESMPKDNIERAIKKGAGGDGENYEEVRYEGFGPGGVNIIVEGLTDNRNRAASNIRTIFSKNGGNLGASGSVTFQFDRLGELTYPASVGSEDKVMEAAIEAGADDVVVYPEDGAIDVVTAPENFEAVKQAMEAAGLAPGYAEVTFRADNDIAVAGETAQQVSRLLGMLEDLDDVQNVYSNADLGDAG